ncbi:MAG: hypothetical protein M1818_001843 [Claussenomyces sp. TS43310]|nr:MAG: hypothetical protein M1818_001843 [Claussenomyces sp. TS43310]
MRITDLQCSYSGGRDGVICSWNLNLDLKSVEDPEDPFADPEEPPPKTSSSGRSSTTFQSQTQAHTHWVNDIVLAQNKTALVSASSDLTVRVWRPFSYDAEGTQTVGQHADYVKCLATPDSQADWVASGGLDRKICLWDLNGAGKKLEIEVGDEERSEKGSVYALSASRSMLASGGPESIVRLWDPRSGNRITKFVGHTDNVRDILINESGDTIMTASSDQTVKVWSVTAGRCMHTLTMHNDSVWSLYSDDPHLCIFYSSDRSGLVVKTDVRGTLGEMDDGLSIAVAQEHESINKVIACAEHIWTATSSSSINRWADIDTGADIQLPDAFRNHRASISSVASRRSQASTPTTNGQAKKDIPARSILRISNTATFPAAAVRDFDTVTGYTGVNGRKGSEVFTGPEMDSILPVHALPEETIEGQHGLVKHKLMNDRRRVLTLDTAGDVLLWDLLKCIPVRSFGKRHLEDVEPEVNTMEAIAPWCSIDTRTGRLAVVLEEYNCFDAEMYADEIELEEAIEFREDQRVNLGKWILRHIFSKLIDEMIKRDEVYRKELFETHVKNVTSNLAKTPLSIEMPSGPITSWEAGSGANTPKANGGQFPTPAGLAIGVATPGISGTLPGVPEDGAPLDKRTSHVSRSSADRSGDYFANASIVSVPDPSAVPPTTTATEEKSPKTPSDADKAANGRETGSLFGKGKKFKMGMSFKKGMGRSVSTASPEKPAAVEEKEEGSETSDVTEKEVDDSFLGIVQRIRIEYDRELLENPGEALESFITPSLPNETPVLKPPPGTTVIIQEETSGGSADLYRGTVDTVGEDADSIEERAPMWLGDLLLRVSCPESATLGM